MSLRNVNLNLLPILQALLREKSVTRAAESMAMSQSAVSDALGKLRNVLGDKLLVRIGGRMEPTPIAVSMMPHIEQLCADLEHFLNRPRFDPGQSRRSFVIATSDYDTVRVARTLLDAIRKVAPHVVLRFVEINDQLAPGLASREIDFAVLPSFFIEDLAPAPLRFRPMFEDTAVALMCAGHPLADKATLTPEDLKAFCLIAFHPGSPQVERKRVYQFMAGQPLHASAFLPQVTLVPQVLIGSLDYGIVPSTLAQWATADGTMIARPLAFAKNSIVIGVAWSPVQDTDPAHMWLRELMLHLFGAP